MDYWFSLTSLNLNNRSCSFINDGEQVSVLILMQIAFLHIFLFENLLYYNENIPITGIMVYNNLICSEFNKVIIYAIANYT